ncbi:spermidine synthase [Nigerium massiliense]|uniref:spermidine synthase n=1 Tax=Nigerium massiliense TaxID=1522317 RepID=UPI00058BA397|nr:fused MFS/spermidine synthase [Nigerium massiliense]
MSERLVPDPSTPGAFRVMTGPTSQSWVDPADPTRLEFEYVQRIADGLDATVLTADPERRLRVVHIGGGGLSLPRYVEARRPHTAQIVLEPDGDLIEEVRRKLPLPRRTGIKVRITDGRAGLELMPADYADAIILDAFDGSTVPPSLVTDEFFDEVVLRLRPGGVFFFNLADRAPFGWAKRVVGGVAERLRHVHLVAEPAVLKGRRYGNLVVAASASPLPHGDLDDGAHHAVFPQRSLFGRELTRWIGGAQAFTDADAAAAPVPREGGFWFQ